MIVPTMTDDEKAYEAFRMTDWLCEAHEEWRPTIVEKFRRGTRFPYFQHGKAKDDKGNEWTLLFFCPTKTLKKRDTYYTLAYLTYDIPRGRKESDVNAGRGCLMFDPISMKRRIAGEGIGTCIMDIVPHAFNRYTERHLVPNGLNNLSFRQKVESILSRWQWFDIMADKYGDVSARKHSDGAICPYDVYMKGGGMLRGQIVNEVLVRFLSYVSEDMMFDNQRERQRNMQSEYWQTKRNMK